MKRLKPHRPTAGLARRPADDSRRLIDRILDTPQLSRVIPQLPAEMLHRVVQRCGLEECGELLALATPSQLAGVLDLDLWRASQPGLDEQLDPERFGAWLDMLAQAGDDAAAKVVARMDADLVAAALAHHVRVIDRAAVPASDDGEDWELSDGLSCDIGGYLVVARRSDSWDAIITVLAVLVTESGECFHRVMRGCRKLSNAGFELDGLDDLLADTDQAAFDLAFGRETRRDSRGYVAPAQARAFLQMARQIAAPNGAAASDNPVARAYFRAIDGTVAREADGDLERPSNGRQAALSETPSEDLKTVTEGDPLTDERQAAVAAVVDVLREAGVLPQQPRGLLEGPQEEKAPRLTRIRHHLQFVRDADPAMYATRSEELAYLANTIIAGCSIQSRAFQPQEASDAAIAICNLGLENWPLRPPSAAAPLGAASGIETGPPLREDFLVGQNLVDVFQAGWSVLYHDVCVYASRQLLEVLANLRCGDRETRAGLDALRMDLAHYDRAGTPWGAREALDVIAILDMPAWAALLGLIDECPVIHGALAARSRRALAVSPTDFEFIAENSQIALIREFIRQLPATLQS